MSPAPLPVLETPLTERIRDLVTWTRHLSEAQRGELLRLIAGRDPDLLESCLRVIPRRCSWCRQTIPGPFDGGRPL